MRNRSTENGQSLVEFALMLPLVLLLIVNAVNFGAYLYAGITVANAARAGAEYAIIGGAMATAPTSPTNAQVSALVTNDLTSLPNRATAQIRICENKNGVETCTCMTGSCTGMSTTPADAENTGAAAALYVLKAVDVKYTYQPFIPLWSFPGLGIRATIPVTTIYRKAVMRSLN